jgi:hypothetical protein
MIIIYVVAALVGGIAGCVLLWPYGATVALVSAPFCGSLFAILAASLVYLRASGKAKTGNGRSGDLDELPKLQSAERQ